MSFFLKYNKPDYFFTTNDFKRILKMVKIVYLIGLIIVPISFSMLCLGVSFLIAGLDYINAELFLSLLGFPLFLISLSTLSFRMLYRNSKIILQAMKSNNTKLLFSLLQKEDLSKMRDKVAFAYAFYALVDIAPNDLLDYLSYNLGKLRSNPHINHDDALNKMLGSLALKLGYKDSGEMLADLEGEKPILYEQSKDDFDEVDLSIPIAKVYFIDKLPIDQRCMISGLPIDLKDIVVICPFCGNMAEKVLMEKWLLEKNFCPICRKKLSIDEIPIVKITS